MRRLFALAVLLLLAPMCRAQFVAGTLAAQHHGGGGGGGNCASDPHCVQYVAQSCASATTCTATITSTGTSHALIVEAVMNNGSSQQVTSVTDSGSQTYTNIFNVVNISTHWTMSMWYICTSNSGITTVTGNWPAATVGLVAVTEESGLSASSCLDQQSSAATLQTQNYSSTNPITTTSATEYIHGVGISVSDVATFVPGTSGSAAWINLKGSGTSTQLGSGSTAAEATFGVQVTSTGTYGLVYTGSISATEYAGGLASFK